MNLATRDALIEKLQEIEAALFSLNESVSKQNETLTLLRNRKKDLQKQRREILDDVEPNL